MRSEFSHKDLKSVGNYTLGRLIGKGSFGKVYLASHKLTNGSKVGDPASIEVFGSDPYRWCSNQPTRATPTSRARSTIIDNSSIPISLDSTRSL